jgi:hypothetical protein
MIRLAERWIWESKFVAGTEGTIPFIIRFFLFSSAVTGAPDEGCVVISKQGGKGWREEGGREEGGEGGREEGG